MAAKEDHRNVQESRHTTSLHAVAVAIHKNQQHVLADKFGAIINAFASATIIQMADAKNQNGGTTSNANVNVDIRKLNFTARVHT